MTPAPQPQFIDTGKITSADDVLQELKILAAQLPGSGLAALATFNIAYIVVTRTIKTASDDGYFSNPSFINAFTVAFANYYFGAINDLSSTNPQIVPAWRLLVESPPDAQRPAFISLLMGANAHINYDLPLTLLQMVNRQTPRGLIKDIRKVDSLLIRAGREILDSFNEVSPRLNFFKRRLRWLYFRPAMYIILGWRIIVWRHYKRLQQGTITPQRMARRSTKIASRLTKLGSHLG